MRPLQLIQTIILATIGVLCLAIAANAQTKSPDPAAIRVVTSWNEAVSTMDAEYEKFRELLESLKRNPPGRVLLMPDVRAAQRKRRLGLIQEIIASHEERIRSLRRLAKAEEASQ